MNEIRNAMIRQIPPDWNSAAFVLEPTEHGLGRGLSHSAITSQPSIDHALAGSQFVTPDASVMAATRKLELSWLERGATFKCANITAERDDEAWGISSSYEH